MAKQGTTLTERYVASMVLSGVGDAMGYKNSEWEFQNSGRSIHGECTKLGGVKNLAIKCNSLDYPWMLKLSWKSITWYT